MTRTLLNLGVDPSKKGFEYLQEALRNLQEDPHIKITVLYDKIAKKFGSNHRAVERCMKTSISKAMLNGDTALQSTIFGHVYTGTPTASTFLHCLRIYLEAHK